MTFANRLFTLSFTLSLWIALLNWKPWSTMWVPVVVFLALSLVTGMICMGNAAREHDEEIELMELAIKLEEK